MTSLDSYESRRIVWDNRITSRMVRISRSRNNSSSLFRTAGSSLHISSTGQNYVYNIGKTDSLDHQILSDTFIASVNVTYIWNSTPCLFWWVNSIFMICGHYQPNYGAILELNTIQFIRMLKLRLSTRPRYVIQIIKSLSYWEITSVWNPTHEKNDTSQWQKKFESLGEISQLFLINSRNWLDVKEAVQIVSYVFRLCKIKTQRKWHLH
jgi:hypothetical protein